MLYVKVQEYNKYVNEKTKKDNYVSIVLMHKHIAKKAESYKHTSTKMIEVEKFAPVYVVCS